jgi:hypothetical protein
LYFYLNIIFIKYKEMGAQGSFGYKIGRKVRLMQVQRDADLLWQILVREIYVLIKHYGTIEALRQAFEELVAAKNAGFQTIQLVRPGTEQAWDDAVASFDQIQFI